MILSDEPGLRQTDVSRSEFEVAAPTSEEEVEKKGVPKRATKSSLTAVLERWLLSILHCRFLVRPVAIFRSFCSEWYQNSSGSFQKRKCLDWRGDCWTVEGCQIAVTRSLLPLTGGPSTVSLRLSTVEVGAGSCCTRRLMMVLFVFERWIY